MGHGPSGPIGPVGPTGPMGSPGVGISTATFDTSGNLTITKTNNTTLGPFNVMGPQGQPGVSIASGSLDTSGNLTFTKTDKTIIGPFSVVGAPGVGVSGAIFDTSGNLTLTKTDNTKFGPFNVMGTGISGATFDNSGNLTLTKTDNTKLGPFNLKSALLSDPAAVMQLKGEKGEPGSIGSYTSVKSNLFDTPLTKSDGTKAVRGATLWCADGDFCQLPAGSKGFALSDNASPMIINNSLNVAGRMNVQGGEIPDIQTPDGMLKLSKAGIMFGGKNAKGMEVNSAQISAGVHDNNSLCLVGMSDGSGSSNTRRITAWAENGFRINGPLLIGNWKIYDDGDNLRIMHNNGKNQRLWQGDGYWRAQNQ